MQQDYNEITKLLSERHEEIVLLKKQNEKFQEKNEALQYETERIRLEYKQRADDLEKSIDQTKIAALRSYLDHHFNSNDNRVSSLPPTTLLQLSSSNMSHSPAIRKSALLVSNDPNNHLQLSSRPSSLQSSHSGDSMSSLEDLNFDSSYGSNQSSAAAYQQSFLALATSANTTKQQKKLSTVPASANYVNNEWRKGLRQRFELIDTDNDGLISLEDFVQFTRQKNPNSPDSQIKKIFHQMDTRGVGRVTWTEFEKCFRRFALKNMALKRLQAAGDRYEDSVPFDERDEFSKLGSKGKLHAIRVWYDNIIYGF